MAKMNVEELFRMYYRPLCLYASHFLGDLDACEEVVQAGFAAFWEKVQKGEDPDSPKSYLYVTVRNQCINALRRKPLPGMDAVPLDPDVLPDEADVDRSFEEAGIWTAIERLPKRRREILLMNKRDGIPADEIAAHFGISERTVQNQVSLALKALRRGMKRADLLK